MKIKASIPENRNIKKWFGDRIKFLNENSSSIYIFRKSKKVEFKEVIFTGSHLVLVKKDGSLESIHFELEDYLLKFGLKIDIESGVLYDFNHSQEEINFPLKEETYKNRLNLLYLTTVGKFTKTKDILED